jgi:hypothetical protein
MRAHEQAGHYGDVLTFHYGAVSFPVFEPVALSRHEIAAQMEAGKAADGGEQLRGGVTPETPGNMARAAAS